MSVEVKHLEARRETVEATIDGELVVRAMQLNSEFRFPERFWAIYLPGATSVLNHELPILYYCGENINAALVEGLAKLIAKAAQ